MLNFIEESLAGITQAAEAGDDELAHAREDRLRLEVLTAFALGNVPIAEMIAAAKLTLTSERQDFNRWCA